MRRATGLLVGLMAILMIAGSASAGAVQWAGNGHWYEAVYSPGGINWADAQAAAVAKGGYLASSTSEAENNFLFSQVNDWKFWYNDPWNSLGPWIGGRYAGAPGTMNPTEWAWVNGDSFSYSRWAPGEPNYASETAIQFFGNGWNNMQPTWNNLDPNNGNPKGYIVEWNANPVPIPGALWLLAPGLAGLAAIRRRFTR